MFSFQVIKDRHLFAVVCVLVMLDVIYLAVWQVLDPMTRTVREFSQEVRGIERFSWPWGDKISLVLHHYPNTIGFKNSCEIYYPIKSKTKINRYSFAHDFRPLRQPHVIATSFDWFTVLSVCFVIDWSNCFCFFCFFNTL